ncbi:MAG TPA: PepSY-associated TM helix domain-containing protein, partial [Burkholderiaceae bacterium]
ISLRNVQRADAIVTISGDLPQHLISSARVSYAGADGRTLDLRDPRQRGFWSRFDGWMEPLHFGDFGGLMLKALYCVLGLSAAGLAISGTVIWADRRRQQHRSGDAAHSSAMAGGRLV